MCLEGTRCIERIVTLLTHISGKFIMYFINVSRRVPASHVFLEGTNSNKGIFTMLTGMASHCEHGNIWQCMAGMADMAGMAWHGMPWQCMAAGGGGGGNEQVLLIGGRRCI